MDTALPQPTLATPRLVLRPFVIADGPRVRELAGDWAIADTTAVVPHPYPEGGGEQWIANHPADWAAGHAVTYGVVLRAEDLLVGAMGLGIERWRAVGVLGYWIGKPYWGRGYATEAAAALLDLAFGPLALHRVEATHLIRNPASGRVMEKLGMRFEGAFRDATLKWGRYEDVAQRAILADEWAAAGVVPLPRAR
jgi:RimJ/RimL family protein N-acetyltransferase